MKIEDKLRGVLTKLLIYHLLITLEYQTWYQIKVTKQFVVSVVSYPYYLIVIFTKINENMRSKRKIAEKLKGYT